MTTICASLADELRHDFSRARVHLAEARLHQAQEDTPDTRAAVARWLSFIDAVLDMYVDTSGPEQRSGTSSAGTPGSSTPDPQARARARR